MPTQPAPGDLELVRAFVNTRDVEAGLDELADGEAVRAWFAARRIPIEGAITEADHRRILEMREALRSLMAANAGHESDEQATPLLNRAAANARLVLSFEEDGRADLIADSTGVDRVAGVLLANVFEAMVAGTWERLKACLNDECSWAFYDHSRNRSGKWCTMAVCGNRMKVRSYRERHGD